MGKIFLFTIIVLGLLFLQNAYANPLSVMTNKIIFAIGDDLIAIGTISNTNDAATINAHIYSSNGTSMNSLSTSSSGGSTNTFSFTSTINSTYDLGSYIIVLTDGVDNVNMSFRVVSQIITLEASPINSGDEIINISTSTEVQESDFLGGNFTEVLNLSKSTPQKIHYGNYFIGGKTYHFVLVDQNNATVYDRLYVDDGYV